MCSMQPCSPAIRQATGCTRPSPRVRQEILQLGGTWQYGDQVRSSTPAATVQGSGFRVQGFGSRVLCQQSDTRSPVLPCTRCTSAPRIVARMLPSGDQEGHLPMHSNMGAACGRPRWKASTVVVGSRVSCRWGLNALKATAWGARAKPRFC